MQKLILFLLFGLTAHAHTLEVGTYRSTKTVNAHAQAPAYKNLDIYVAVKAVPKDENSFHVLVFATSRELQENNTHGYGRAFIAKKSGDNKYKLIPLVADGKGNLTEMPDFGKKSEEMAEIQTLNKEDIVIQIGKSIPGFTCSEGGEAGHFSFNVRAEKDDSYTWSTWEPGQYNLNANLVAEVGMMDRTNQMGSLNLQLDINNAGPDLGLTPGIFGAYRQSTGLYTIPATNGEKTAPNSFVLSFLRNDDQSFLLLMPTAVNAHTFLIPKN